MPSETALRQFFNRQLFSFVCCLGMSRQLQTALCAMKLRNNFTSGMLYLFCYHPHGSQGLIFTYGSTKFPLPLVGTLTTDEFTTNKSFTFAVEIIKQDSNLFAANLNVNSLFLNIPYDKTIDVCVKELFQNQERVGDLTETEFRQLFQRTLQRNVLFCAQWRILKTD